MSWNARLVDGPHEGRTVVVEEEDSSDVMTVAPGAIGAGTEIGRATP